MNDQLKRWLNPGSLFGNTPISIKFKKVYETYKDDPNFLKLSDDEQFTFISHKVFSKKEAFFVNFEEFEKEGKTIFSPIITICFGVPSHEARRITSKTRQELLKDPEFAKLSERDQMLNAEILCGE
jgi:hypothetical protein